MKKFLILLCALSLVLAVTMSARAALVTITFDEEGISANCPPQGSGDLITIQYLDLGVEWIVDPITEQPHNEVTRGECFNQQFDIGSENQVLWINGNPVEGDIQLDLPADSLVFDYRKPSGTASDPVQVKLYNGDDPNPVYDSGVFSAIGEWQTFTYNATDPSGYFDRIQMYSPTNKKFVIDNLEVNTVVRITFDEEGISANCPPQGSGDLITIQYLDLGVEWIVDPITEQPHNEVTRGECFNQQFDIGSENQVLWINGSPVEGNIELDLLAGALVFDYRKPSGTASDPVQVKLYNGLAEVYDSGIFSAIGEWQTFTYNATDSSGSFDRIVMSSTHKFVIDNLVLNRVLFIDKVKPRRCYPGQIIRIIGSGFGQLQGESHVHIGPKVYGPGHTKIKLWTGTEIKVELPNYNCEWFKGNDYKGRNIWVTVGGTDSNKKRLRVIGPEPCKCDLNGDCVCNETDLAIFGDEMGRLDCNEAEGDCKCDLNHDGRCDAEDGVIFTEEYGRSECR